MIIAKNQSNFWIQKNNPMEVEISSVSYVKCILSYPYEYWQHPVEERVTGALERV